MSASRLLPLLVLMASPCWATSALVQHKATASTANSINVAVTPTSGITAGNAIVLVIGNLGTRTATVTDEDANTYTQAVKADTSACNAINGVAEVTVYYRLSAPSGIAGPFTVTFSGSAGTFEKWINFFEFSPTAGNTFNFDLCNTTTGSSSANTTTGVSITTTGNGFAVGGTLGNGNDINANPKAGNDFTAGGDNPSSTWNPAACSKITTAGAQQPVWGNSTDGPFATLTMALKEVSAGGATGYINLPLLGVG